VRIWVLALAGAPYTVFPRVQTVRRVARRSCFKENSPCRVPKKKNLALPARGMRLSADLLKTGRPHFDDERAGEIGVRTTSI